MQEGKTCTYPEKIRKYVKKNCILHTMPKDNPAIITFFAILYISLVPMMGFHAFAQENAPASSEAVPEAEVATDTGEEEEGFDDEFEDEFGDAEKEVLIH